MSAINPSGEISDPALAIAFERQRLEALYARMPGAIASIMIGVLLVFVLLLPSAQVDLLKAWAAYMLTTLAMRGWLWMQFRNSLILPEHLTRWEWACAVAMGLTCLGWTVLCGPLFPAQPALQNFVLMLIIIVANSGLVVAAASRMAFLLFVVPTLLPCLWRFVEVNGYAPSAIVAAVGCALVVALMYQGVRALVLENLRKRVEAEQLLAEQQAIFQGATVGIAVFETGALVKCNPRFGELFGRGVQASTTLGAVEFFAQPEEAERFVRWAEKEFDAARTARSMERMRRADGSQFWAELSGQRIYHGDTVRTLWLVNEAALQSGGGVRG